MDEFAHCHWDLLVFFGVNGIFEAAKELVHFLRKTFRIEFEFSYQMTLWLNLLDTFHRSTRLCEVPHKNMKITKLMLHYGQNENKKLAELSSNCLGKTTLEMT